MNLWCNHAKIKSKSRNVEQLQRFSRKSEKIRANFMKLRENHDEIETNELFSISDFENGKKSTKPC